MTNPKNADSDEDGLSDIAEIQIHNTDPNNADTDGDTVEDGLEASLPVITYFFNPKEDSTEYIQALRTVLSSLLPYFSDTDESAGAPAYRMGEMSLEVDNAEVSIQITIEESTNGVSWHATTNVIEIVRPASGNAGFYDLEFE